MKLIVDRWYVGPIVACIGLYLCWLAGLINGQSKMETKVQAELGRVYSLASQGKYDQILAEGLATKESVKYLRMQDQCLGRIASWTDAWISAGPFGPSWSGSITVRRKLADVTDLAAGDNSHDIKLALDPGENDATARTLGDPGAIPPRDSHEWDEAAVPPPSTPIHTPEQAINAARPIIHRLDADEKILPPLMARQSEDFWIVEENVKSDGRTDTRYLVFGKDGDLLERVRAGRFQ